MMQNKEDNTILCKKDYSFRHKTVFKKGKYYKLHKYNGKPIMYYSNSETTTSEYIVNTNIREVGHIGFGPVIFKKYFFTKDEERKFKLEKLKI